MFSKSYDIGVNYLNEMNKMPEIVSTEDQTSVYTLNSILHDFFLPFYNTFHDCKYRETVYHEVAGPRTYYITIYPYYDDFSMVLCFSATWNKETINIIFEKEKGEDYFYYDERVSYGGVSKKRRCYNPLVKDIIKAIRTKHENEIYELFSIMEYYYDYKAFLGNERRLDSIYSKKPFMGFNKETLYDRFSCGVELSRYGEPTNYLFFTHTTRDEERLKRSDEKPSLAELLESNIESISKRYPVNDMELDAQIRKIYHELWENYDEAKAESVKKRVKTVSFN